MKIIYDTDKPVYERVTIEDYFADGMETPAACFDIKVEFSNDGVHVSDLHCSRWGNFAKRKKIHEAVWKKIQEATEQQLQPKSKQ